MKLSIILVVTAFAGVVLTRSTDPILRQNERDSPQKLPGNSLFFGDMELNKKQQDALKKGWNMGGLPKGASNSFAAVKGVNLRWTDGIIPYEIDCSLENLEDAVDAVKKAMAEWEAKTCIRFVKRTNQKYFLKFFRDTHCWGNVGMTSYTKISVGYGCEYQHVMTHEIGHVVGFYHEQNRKDRDQYVEVHWENIGQFADAFDIVKNTDSFGVPYDYESIMHYPWNAFSSNGKNTMTPKKNVNGKTPYVELSKADAEQVSLMYDCPAIERKRAAAAKNQFEAIPKIKFKDCIDKHKYCPGWADGGFCVTDEYTKKNCLMSCNSPVCSGSDCKDKYNDCPAWAKIGHCSLNPTVARECQKSCNPTCKGQPPATQLPVTQPPVTQPPVTQPPVTQPPVTQPPVTQPPVTQPPVTGKPKPTQKPGDRNFLGKGKLCRDTHKQCAHWASIGECEANPGWMLYNCMKSCKVTNCDMTVLKPSGSCANPLGLSWDGTSNFKIPDSAFSSPEHLSPGGSWEASAANARLYFEDDYDNKRIGAWCAASHNSATADNTGYVQVDLGQERTIRYIATQGRDKYFERVGSFKILYSNDGSNFQIYQVNGKDKVFTGNCDHVTPVLNEFTTPIKARYVRYRPWEWNYPCLRMEFYGC